MSEEDAAVESRSSGKAWRAAQAFGCDMELLEESLAMSPAERLRLHDIAIRRVVQLEAALKEARGLLHENELP